MIRVMSREGLYVSGSTVAASQAVQAAFPATGLREAVSAQTSSAAATPATQPTNAAASPLLPNPRLTVAPGLNRVVLEYFNSDGLLENSIPSQRQLEAYRLAALSGTPADAQLVGAA
jgi:hypothetical protein